VLRALTDRQIAHRQLMLRHLVNEHQRQRLLRDGIRRLQ
jgi:hypothetical protein